MVYLLQGSIVTRAKRNRERPPGSDDSREKRHPGGLDNRGQILEGSYGKQRGNHTAKIAWFGVILTVLPSVRTNNFKQELFFVCFLIFLIQ